MKRNSCKRLLILFINFCILVSTAQAQDSAKATSTVAPAKSPAANTQTKPVSKVAKPMQATPTGPASNLPTQPTSKISGQNSAAVQARGSDPSINGQYEELLKYSWMQQGYKVINPNRLSTLWKSVNDSLSTSAKLLIAAQQKIELQEKELSDIKNQRAQKTATVEASRQTVHQLHVLGMLVDVSTYNWIMLGLIVLLTTALAIVSFTISKSINDSKYYKQQFNELTDEYQAYKVKANDKEKRLARELQTERNTLEDLKEELANRKQ